VGVIFVIFSSWDVAWLSVKPTRGFHCKISDRDEHQIALTEAYLKAVQLFRDYSDASQDPVYSQVSFAALSLKCFVSFCLFSWGSTINTSILKVVVM
jgi:hypothetical protein